MRAKECVWLNNLKCLFPELGTAGKNNKPETVTTGKQRTPDLLIQDTQLLAQEGIFCNEIGTATQIQADD